MSKSKLTALRQAVLDIVEKSPLPLKAYDILATLKKSTRPNAQPATVYRVLDYLVEHGFLHRINSTQQYTRCHIEKKDCDVHGANTEILLICKHCQAVEEIDDVIITLALKQITDARNFTITSQVYEVSGYCDACAE